MKTQKLFLSVLTCLLASGMTRSVRADDHLGDEQPSRIYIAVGDPNVKKGLLAIEKTQGIEKIANEFNMTINSNMDFTDLFEILPQDKMPESKKSMSLDSIPFAAYRSLGVDFLIKSALSESGNQIIAEVRLFDVAKGTQILGRRYPLAASSPLPGRELAHFSSNEIVKALTGEDGVFRTRIIMSCGQRIKEIYMMDFDGQNVRQLTRDGNLALSPNWAHDGRRMLFTSYKPAVRGGPTNPNLYMFDMLTGQRRLLSAAIGLNTGGSFHPKENLIAYTFSQSGKARPEIYLLDLNSNTRKPITRTQFFTVEPSWAPDGNRLVYSSSQTGRPHIFVANRDGSSPKRLTFAGVYNSSPNWSPRGDKIVFSGQETQGIHFNIFLIDPNGSNLVRLTDGSQSSENPVFSADGRHIAYSSNQTGNYRIYVMTARGTKIRAISPTGLGPCKQPAWSPRL